MNTSARNIDETKFMALLCDGNPQAMEIWYDQFAAVAYGIIIRIVKEETTAEELLRQTFVYIRKNHSDFNPSKQTLSLWVIGIARKLALEKMPFLSYARNRNSSSNVNHTQIGELFEQGQATRTTSDTTNSMTAEEKQVLDLVFFGGGKIEEVANLLRMDETKIKQLLQAAVNHYRKERREVLWK